MVGTAIGDWLDKETYERRMSYSRLARLAGLDPSTISRLANGGRRPTPEVIEMIADGLHLDPLPRRDLNGIAFTGMTPIADALDYLVEAERLVNADRPECLSGSKNALRSYSLALIVELSELLQELDWKPWKTRTDEPDVDRIADEFADVLAFLGIITANVMSQTGLTAEDLSKAFRRKTQVNIERANGYIDGYVPAGGTGHG